MNSPSNFKSPNFFYPISEKPGVQSNEEALPNSLLKPASTEEESIDELATIFARTTPFSPISSVSSPDNRPRPSVGAHQMIVKSTQPSVLSGKRSTAPVAEGSEDRALESMTTDEPNKKGRQDRLLSKAMLVTPKLFQPIPSSISPSEKDVKKESRKLSEDESNSLAMKRKRGNTTLSNASCS
jgi:hypothetical protein